MLLTRVKLTENLLVFERGGMMLLVNGVEMRPILVKRGRKFCASFSRRRRPGERNGGNPSALKVAAEQMHPAE